MGILLNTGGMLRFFLAVSLILFSFPALADSQSILHLKDGSRLIGLVEAWTGQYYLVRSPSGHLSRIESRRVQSVENQAFPRKCTIILTSGRTIVVRVLEIVSDGPRIELPEEKKARESLFEALEKEPIEGKTLEIRYEAMDSMDLFPEKKESENPPPAM